jgi:hypothetical protein
MKKLAFLIVAILSGMLWPAQLAADTLVPKTTAEINGFNIVSVGSVEWRCGGGFLVSCFFHGLHQINDGGVGTIKEAKFDQDVDYADRLVAATIYSHCYRGYIWASNHSGSEWREQQSELACAPGPPSRPPGGGGQPVACDPGHTGCTEGFPEPLILDLNGDGIHTVAFDQSPVSFDMDGNGAPDVTAWTDPATEEGFLFYDLNHNGVIDGGQELFGDATTLPNGKRATTGVEVLGLCDTKRYGGNGDGVISPGDAAYGKIRVWVDRNHDAVATRDETYSLGELAVTELSLQFRELTAAESWGVDATGNYHRFQGSFTQRLGPGHRVATVTRAMDDVYFRALMSGN